MKYSADVRGLIAKLQATLAGSSEGRGALIAEAIDASNLAGGTGPLSMPEEPPETAPAGRPSLEPTGCDDWHEQYTAHMAEALRKQAARTAAYKRKLRREAEAAREERRRGRTYPPDGTDPFRGF